MAPDEQRRGTAAPGGLLLFIQDGPPDATGVVSSTGQLIGNLQGGLVLGGVTVVLVGVGVVLFARRDLS